MPHSNTIHVSKFKARAKDLLKSVRLGKQHALAEVEPYFDDVSNFKLTQAQLVVARSLECDSWSKLVQRKDWLACSFCKKWQYELNKLIAGPDVYVCDSCVELCNDILRDERQQQ